MRKFVVFLLLAAITALCCLPACAENQADPETDATGYLGVWHSDLGGMASTLTIYEDGTFDYVYDMFLNTEYDSAINQYGRKWVFSGGGIILNMADMEGNELEIPLVLEDGRLREASGAAVYERGQASDWTPPAARAEDEVALEDFTGAWQSDHVLSVLYNTGSDFVAADGRFQFPEDSLFIYFESDYSTLGNMYWQIDGTSASVVPEAFSKTFELFPDRKASTFNMVFENGRLHYEQRNGDDLLFSLTFIMLEDDIMRMEVYRKEFHHMNWGDVYFFHRIQAE